jgi:6-phosphogluconolactonase (cycloisomerase 2 family)
MKVRLLCIAALIGAAVWLMSCGHYVCHTTLGASSCTPAGAGKNGGGGITGNSLVTAIVYFMDDSAGQFAAEAVNLNKSGTFSPVPGFTGPASIGSVADGGMVIVNKKYLYIPVVGGTVQASFGRLYGYAINTTTADLTPVPNSPYTVNGLAGQFNTAFSIAADPLGRFVFVGDTVGISVYAISPTDGSLTLQNATPFSTGISSPIQMATDGLGKYLYVLDGTNIAEFSYAGGALTALSTTSVFTGPPNIQMLAAEPSGKYMLGITEQLGGTGPSDTNVYIFAITQAGGTAPGTLGTPTVFNTGTNSPSYIAVHPNGNVVYTFNETTAPTGFSREPIVVMAFNSSTGVLSNATPFPTVLSEKGILDQSGTYIFAIGEETNATAAGMIPITVGTDGSLSVSIAHQGAPGNTFAVTDAQ